MTNALILAIALAIAAVYGVQIAWIEPLAFSDPLGPRAFPLIVLGGLLLVAVMLSIEMFVARRQNAETGVIDFAHGSTGGGWIIACVMFWFVGYALVFERLGFIISTIIFTYGLLHFLSRDTRRTNVAVSILFPIAIYVLFVHILRIRLPGIEF